METNNKKCYNCAKDFRTPADLQKHKSRKTPCVIREINPGSISDPNRCIYCNRVFTRLQNLNRHYGICKIRNGGMQILVEKTEQDELREQNRAMQLRVEELENRVSEMSKLINPAVFNTTVNNLTIKINCWDAPDLQALTEKNKFGVSKIVELIRENLVGAPLALVREVWFNPNIPFNHSLYLKNKLTGEVLVHDGSRWRVDNIKQVSGKLRDRAYGWTQHVGKLVQNELLMQQLRCNQADASLLVQELESIRNIVYEGRDLVKSRLGGVPKI